MKTIGLIGGMSWESTQTYYRIINQAVGKKLGKLHSARIVMNRIDFEPVEKGQRQNDWLTAANILVSAARSIEAAGADCVLICANTMHKVYRQVEESISIPVIHIADAVGEQLKISGLKHVGLLGTAFTMDEPFYKQRLTDNFGIKVTTPDEEDRAAVHRIIYEELCHGKIKPESKHTYLKIIEKLSNRGVQGVILGCTEIGLLVSQCDTETRLFDTVEIHGLNAVEFALSKE